LRVIAVAFSGSVMKCSPSWGVAPREQLVKSPAPFADAARLIWGPWAAGLVELAVIISSLGALNGWTRLIGQVPMAAAQDRLFPALFGRISSRGVPAIGILFSAGLATALVLIHGVSTPGFSAFFNLVVGLSTMAAVIPYAFRALAGGLVAARVAGGAPAPPITRVEPIAFVASVFTLYGCERKRCCTGCCCWCSGFQSTFGSGPSTRGSQQPRDEQRSWSNPPTRKPV
jgi:basic amino acid/polyamine antiporter, APA family